MNATPQSSDAILDPPVSCDRKTKRSLKAGSTAPPLSPLAIGDGDQSDSRPSSLENNGERDTNGRFAKGNRGGPGNPFARRLAAMRRTLLSVVSEDDLENAARKLIEQARQGDLVAIKLLFTYVIGKPAESVDPDTVDHQELDLYRQGQARMSDILGILNSLPPAMACEIVRQVLPYAAKDVARRLMAFLQIQSPGATKS